MKRIVAFLMAITLVISGISYSAVDSYAEDIQEQQESQTGETEVTEVTEVIEEDITDETSNYGDTTTASTDETESSDETQESVDDGLEPQSMDNANSWRYQNGQNILKNVTRAISPNAWKKVNGSFVNSQGDVIPGAKKKGMDISYAQGRIDWEKVKASDIEYVIIRCGFGNNETSQDDTYWEYNVSECERLGIPYGIYLYSYATNTTMAASEADHVIRLLKGHNPAYPVYLDMEDDSTIKAGNTTLGNIAKIFCDKVSAAGYTPGIYANLNWWTVYLTSSVFNNTSWSKWVAQYNVKCEYTGDYDMWQCTSVGKVDGVTGNVDLNFWMGDTANGGNGGTSGSGKTISVASHQQTYGWLPAVGNGEESGVTGKSKRLEALKISIGSGYGDLGIQYRVHCQTYGWMNWVSDGGTAGTTGEAKRIEAIEIKLTGSQASNYDVYYRTHCQTYGWLGWAKNGASAGTTGLSKRVEAIQVKIVPKGSAAPGSTANAFKGMEAHVTYQAHQQTYGWFPSVSDGEEAGVTGLSKRMEAVKISLTNTNVSGGIQYRVHCQTYGWQDWVSGGGTAGTVGKAKRLEAIQIKLTGEMANKYDVYYRVHSQTYGWLGWAKNGASAGTEGLAKRLEAIEIVLVEKGGAAPGSTNRPFVK